MAETREIIARIIIKEDKDSETMAKYQVIEALEEAIAIIKESWGKPLGMTITGRTIKQSFGNIFLGDTVEIEYNETGIWEQF